MSLFTRLAGDRRGNVATMFALAMVPIIGAVGVAIDYSRVANVRAKLVDALDAGVLAVGSQAAMSDKEAFDTVQEWVVAHMGTNYSKYWHLDSVTQGADGKIVALASGTVDTTIARVLGVTTMPINVRSEAVRSLGKVEIALVLDNTGSMKGTKISKLKEAANALVDTLAKATVDPNDLRIGLVPFSQTVNVGPTYQNASWIDAGGNSASAKSLFLGQTVNRINLFAKVGKSWGGCVESRAMPYETNGEPPVAGVPESLYVPYFAPDEPGGKGAAGNNAYNNSYIADTAVNTVKSSLKTLGLSTNWDNFQLLQGDIAKYKGSPHSGTTQDMGYQYGPNSGCEIAPLLRLSTDAGKVKSAINAMIANGNTDIPMGLAWGWNVIAPQAPFNDAVKYGDDEWTKIVVLMTDGNNQNMPGNEENESLYSGIGYIWQGRMGITSGNEAQRATARDARLAEMCKNMKDDGVIIYTVRVEVFDGSSNVLKNCASETDKFFDVKNVADLTGVFQNIGGSIQKLRLAR